MGITFYDEEMGEYYDYLDALACERASDCEYGYGYFTPEHDEIEELLEGEEND